MSHQVHHTAQPVQVEQGQGLRVGRECRQGCVIGSAHRDRDMSAVRAAHDEIGFAASTSADTDNLDALPPERVMRVGDSDESRNRLG